MILQEEFRARSRRAIETNGKSENKPVKFTPPESRQLLQKRFDAFNGFDFVNKYYIAPSESV